ncbi:coumarin 8-geranyltransferase 1b, chloroplastic-like [Macadamia integrifolia]|uniref:coumarin 8-geranyltransferase 1b, chloroplastic-like n=1 Tax=Macadamia integrifolia TaxID=60698 RepID=UPI001C4F852A|nr:coumarin 8-geranyltransferase 1b, chloroplastic-like [Macadamia integrifolia]
MSVGYLHDIGRKCNVKQSSKLSALADNQGGHIEKLPNEKYALENNELSLKHGDDGGYASLLHKLETFYHFCRPYALMGMDIGILSISLLPIQSVADLSPRFFMGLLQALALGPLTHIYIVAVNQLYDVKIDEVNKQYLPLASGEFSTRDVHAICLIVTILSIGIVYVSKSPALLWGLVANYLFGTAYSAQLPFLRWKRHPLLAMSTMVLWCALGIQIPYFIHIQKYVLGRPNPITKSLIFQTIVLCTYGISGTILKDIPDTDGDRENGIDTLSIRFGRERAFAIGVNVLYAQFGLAMALGASSSLWFAKLISVLGHLALALVVWYRSRHTDPTNKSSAQSFYMFFWKLVCVEYLLLQFVR